jgi:hypothetical protein
MRLLRQTEIRLVSNQVLICSEEAQCRFPQPFRFMVFVQMTAPYMIGTKKRRERLDEDAVMNPNEMKLGVFRYDNVSAADNLLRKR